jgi:geranylgeranyl diphosphate synthase, type II
MMRLLDEWMLPRRSAIERWLEPRFDDVWPKDFGRACHYPLSTGGKRMRPLLCLAAHESITGTWAPALQIACAFEMVHTYSLVHDDLPAMDDADERRDRPTVHKVWSEATAVLVGDGLLTDAFGVIVAAELTDEVKVTLVRLLASAAGSRGMVGGQAADIGIGGKVRDLETLERLHRKKTGALIEASVVAGGIVAGADTKQLQALAEYGQAVGLAFQLADDLLDKDEVKDDGGPPSFVALLGEFETRRRASLLGEKAAHLARDAVGHRSEILAALAHLAVHRAT